MDVINTNFFLFVIDVVTTKIFYSFFLKNNNLLDQSI